MIKLNSPFKENDISKLKSGDKVLISGTLYIARDAAHKQFISDYENKKEIPFKIQSQGIYYAGPCPNKPGEVIGSVGPTTSYRMDDYTLFFLERGLKVMIGKGKRNQTVIDSMKKNNAVYIGATGGTGALIKKCIKESTVIAYEYLQAEAIRKIIVEDFPGIVIIDSKGNNLYD